MGVNSEKENFRNENAARCYVSARPVRIHDYVAAISPIIGASHIIAAFEERNSIKVYFDDKRHVTTLIKSCLHVMNRHILVDYVIPPGTKLILSNVYPTITNDDITERLKFYGSIVSPIVCLPITDDVEFCHVASGIRNVYMKLNRNIPEEMEFKLSSWSGRIKIKAIKESTFLLHSFTNIDGIRGDSEGSETDSSVNDNVTPVKF